MFRRLVYAAFAVLVVVVAVVLFSLPEKDPPDDPELTFGDGITRIEGLPGHPGIGAAIGEERRLDPGTRDRLVEALSRSPGHAVNLGMVAGDAASLRLVGDFKLALDAAEWTTLLLIDIGFSIPVRGYALMLSENPDAEESAAAKALEAAFAVAGLRIERHTDPNKPVPGVILLIGDTP